MKHIDTDCMVGILTIKKFDKNKILIDEYIEKNLIVDRARYTLARLIGNGLTGIYINDIGFGTGTVAPAITDLTLTAPFTKSIDSVTYADGVSATFNWSLALSEANGMAITEFGLFWSNGDLFSRKTRSAINKASDFSLNGSWQIIF